ncbi:DUF7282 domain-containing protein [Halosegnis marinus]|uniref:DUF7282 domain-containing protein n=1 Tax=Halosegnis marinus TaxID=3034023 RepID=UPI003617C440
MLGHTRLRAGEGFRTEVRVPVDDAAWADWNGSATVHLVLRDDRDGDGEFDPEEDGVVTSFGRPAAATVSLARGDRAAVSARDFTPLRAANGSVTVRYAALPADGHLVVENGTDGATLGSVALDAGDHRNVSVPLGDAATGDETFPVRAVLYRDDGDGTFDGDDTPALAGDSPVATTFSVTPEAANATATPPLVVTATPFDDGTATPTASPSPTEPPTATPGQPGFGALAAVAALALVLVARRP